MNKFNIIQPKERFGIYVNAFWVSYTSGFFHLLINTERENIEYSLTMVYLEKCK